MSSAFNFVERQTALTSPRANNASHGRAKHFRRFDRVGRKELWKHMVSIYFNPHPLMNTEYSHHFPVVAGTLATLAMSFAAKSAKCRRSG
jgi:hypothetical protein